MASVKLTNVKKVYDKKVVAVHDFNLDIKDKEFVVFVGPSGCGKSTTLRMIAGLEEISEGTVEIDGVVVNDLQPKDRDIAMVFQNYALYPHLTVFENMAFSLRLKKVPNDEVFRRVTEAAKVLGITEYLTRKPRALSGGQRQRVAIGRAMVRDSKVFLMDEPLSNLDAKLRVQLRNELKKMQKDFGITTIYVTHDQEEALTLSDRIAVFNKGVIEQIGTPNEVYNHSATEFVCNFIGDINRLETPLVQYLNDRGAGLDTAKHNYIRLERLHVNVQPRDGELALDGVVESREYYGLYIKYYINVEGQTLKVIEKNDGVNIYEPGQKVSVVINPSHVMAYEASEEAAHE